MFGRGRSIAKNKGVYVDTDDDVNEPVAQYLQTKMSSFLHVEHDKSISGDPVEVRAKETSNELAAEKEWSSIMGFSCDGFLWVGAFPETAGLWISVRFRGSGKSPLSIDRDPSLRDLVRNAQHSSLCLTRCNLVLAASKGMDWRQQERDAVNDAFIPSCYAIGQVCSHKFQLVGTIAFRSFGEELLDSSGLRLM